MKKLMILAAAVAAMAACTKSEVVYDDNDTEIALAPVNYMTTKMQYGPQGGESGTEYSASEEKNIPNKSVVRMYGLVILVHITGLKQVLFILQVIARLMQ